MNFEREGIYRNPEDAEVVEKDLIELQKVDDDAYFNEVVSLRGKVSYQDIKPLLGEGDDVRLRLLTELVWEVRQTLKLEREIMEKYDQDSQNTEDGMSELDSAKFSVYKFVNDMKMRALIDDIVDINFSTTSESVRYVTSELVSALNLNSFSHIKSGGISLYEVMSNTEKDREFYRSFISYFVNITAQDNPFVDGLELQGDEFSRYRNIFSEQGRRLPGIISALKFCSSQDFRSEDGVSELDGEARVAVSKFHSICKDIALNLKDFRSKKLEYFDDLLLEYLQSDPNSQEAVVAMLVDDFMDLKDLYMSSYNARSHKDYGVLYTKLCDVIHEYLRRSDFSVLLTKCDVEDFSDGVNEDADVTLVNSQLAELHSKCFSNKVGYSCEFEAEDGIFGSGGEFFLEKDSQNINKCAFIISMEERSKSIVVSADFKKNIFSWNFLEGQEEIPDIYKKVIDFIIDKIQQGVVQGEIEDQFVKKRKYKFSEEKINENSRVFSKKYSRSLWENQNSRSLDDEVVDGEDFNRIIVMDDNSIKKLSQDDKMLVRDKIEQFNTGKNGRITKLRKTAGRGEEQLYRLRAGDYRLILKLADYSTDEVSAFEVVRVGKRGDIYRKI